MTASSYDVGASHRDQDSEIERLRDQASSSWEKERRNLVRFGLRDGMSVLDVGCGPGFVTEQLLTSFPGVRLTALEFDNTLAKKAAHYLAGQPAERVRVINASIIDSGLESNSFDFAVARLVFQHLSQPVDAARAIRRLLRPGGKLVIIDSDDAIWGLADPGIPEMGVVLETYGRAQRAQGGNRLIGRHLWRILENAAYVNLDLDAVIAHSDELGLGCFSKQLDADRLNPLAEADLLSCQQIREFRSSCNRLFASARPLVMMVLLMACGEKP